MFVTGPDVVKEVTNEIITQQELGGADTHGEISGVAHFAHDSEEKAIAHLKVLLSYLPSSWKSPQPILGGRGTERRECPILRDLVPSNSNKPYDMAHLIEEIVDQDSLLQVHENYARNILTGLARIGGRPVGVVGNNPLHLAGVLDIAASQKAARFVRFCDCYSIPIITFVDVPGFLPGVDQEHNGIIKNGAKLLYAYSEATTPLITTITRKAYGGAYDVMASKHIRADLNFSFPGAEIAVMGAKGAVNILHRREIQADSNAREEYIERYEKQFAHPYIAAERGYVDEVIDPAQTRNRILDGLEIFSHKQVLRPERKHGNIPL
jgi:acetyl-CoA carboxylase carboxyltransferase component